MLGPRAMAYLDRGDMLQSDEIRLVAAGSVASREPNQHKCRSGCARKRVPEGPDMTFARTGCASFTRISSVCMPEEWFR